MAVYLIGGFYPQVPDHDGYVFVQHEAVGKSPAAVVKINLRDYYPKTFRRDQFAFVQDEVAKEIFSGFTTIDLKGIYKNPIIEDSNLVKVTNEVADELLAEKRNKKAYDRRMRYNKVLFTDMETEIEATESEYYNNSPERILDSIDPYHDLYCALNSLPEIQRRRVTAHYLHGISQKKIALNEGVSEAAICLSIEIGLKNMKKYFQNNFPEGLNF